MLCLYVEEMFMWSTAHLFFISEYEYNLPMLRHLLTRPMFTNCFGKKYLFGEMFWHFLTWFIVSNYPDQIFTTDEL